MGESLGHADLVQEIVAWVSRRHGDNRGLSLVHDSVSTPSGRKPWPVGGFVPDVIAQTFPPSFFLIGEAKSSLDLGTVRTRKQLEMFVRHLAIHQSPVLVVATPLLMVGYAKSLVRQIMADCDGVTIDVVFIGGTSAGKSVEC